MEDNKLSIKVNVADRYYPLRIDREDEEKIRRAAKMINEKVLQYKQHYTDKDTQDFLAMAALQFVTRSIEDENKQDITEMMKSLSDLNVELGQFIKTEE